VCRQQRRTLTTARNVQVGDNRLALPRSLLRRLQRGWRYRAVLSARDRKGQTARRRAVRFGV
jgi:hypothetical protein